MKAIHPCAISTNYVSYFFPDLETQVCFILCPFGGEGWGNLCARGALFPTAIPTPYLLTTALIFPSYLRVDGKKGFSPFQDISFHVF